MSYFMIAVGAKPDVSALTPIEAISIDKAQSYVRELAITAFPPATRTDVWFIHDGRTGTSHDFIQESENVMKMERTPLTQTALGKVIAACSKAGNSMRIWWAGGDESPKRCSTVDEMIRVIMDQISKGEDISTECG